MDKARYDHYRLYRVNLGTEQILKTFQELEARSDSYVFYGHARVVGQNVTLMVAAHKIAEFVVDILQKYNVQHELLESNMQRKMDEEALTVLPKTTKGTDFDWKHYFHLETINDWLEKCASDHSFVTSISLGDSFEGLPIKGVKVAFNPDKPAIFVEGGIHAREWISPATATFILNEILTSNDPKVVDLRENYTWYVFPIVNPDGYKFTFEYDRLWRKNRQPHSLVYKGVDLNRNFDSAWNGNGSSSDPANYDYSGSKAFSEPETASMAKFVLEHAKEIKSYIALHSYSQLVMFPFGHTGEPISNYEDHKRIVDKAKTAIHETHGQIYYVGSKHETIYPSSGGSIDWAYATAKIPISLTFELRGAPDSRDMFILPADQIIPTAEETLAAFVAIVNEAKALGYYNSL